jgi:hypothetical protein
MCASVSPVEKRSKETEEVVEEEDLPSERPRQAYVKTTPASRDTEYVSTVLVLGV